MTHPNRLRTFLWFPERLEEALRFYTETLGDVTITEENRNADGHLFTADFTMLGREFIGMEHAGGPTFNDSISLSVECDGQDETDRLWDAFTAHGTAGRCGWLVDEFGLSWQISPRQMRDHLGDPDPARSAYAWEALRGMGKIVIKDLIPPSA